MIERIEERIKVIEERLQEALARIDNEKTLWSHGYDASAIMKFRNELQWLRSFKEEFEFYYS